MVEKLSSMNSQDCENWILNHSVEDLMQHREELREQVAIMKIRSHSETAIPPNVIITCCDGVLVSTPVWVDTIL